jgi:hyperosmotically inducible periplasmic protein
VKVEAKPMARASAILAIAAIMAAALSGCAVAMLNGAAHSGGASAPAPASRSGTGGAAGKSQVASDGSISTAVRSRFSANASLKTLKIGVDTHDGVVTLRGQVNTVEQRNAAQAEARAVVGVQGVNNQLTVR